MITAVDSSVLLDVLGGDARFGDASRNALRQSLLDGSVIACEVVWAETTGWFRAASGSAAVGRLRVSYDSMGHASAELAGRAWGDYRAAGWPRQRLIGDFLVGAPASLQADRLLTRDRGFYRRYFADLTVVDPTPSAS
ncbi:MAG: type II toxin-antitoxin system VapC family toxin [Candidatus Limnocylindria bacterium]